MSQVPLTDLLDQLTELVKQDPDESLKLICASLTVIDAPTLARQPEVAQRFINLVDRALDATKPDRDSLRKCLRALRKICGLTGRLPTSYVLLDGCHKIGDSNLPAAQGGAANVWEGRYNGAAVAFKDLRVAATDSEENVTKKFCKEVVIWKRLSHDNVLPFLGVTRMYPPSMVSEWMFNGNLTEYVGTKPTANRLKLLTDICVGLEFLHSFDIVHGDLKAANILIDSNGRARLADFGVTSIISHLNSINPSTIGSRPRGTYRWMAPELLVPDSDDLPDSSPLPPPSPSTKSDIYALAMVIIELFTGLVPFPDLAEPTMIFRIMLGKRPPRPGKAAAPGLSDPIWKMVEKCWATDPERRPDIKWVLESLSTTV